MKYLIPIFITLLISNCKERRTVSPLPTKAEKHDTEEADKKAHQRLKEQFNKPLESEVHTIIEIVPIKSETKTNLSPSQDTQKMSREFYAEQFKLIKSESLKQKPEKPKK